MTHPVDGSPDEPERSTRPPEATPLVLTLPDPTAPDTGTHGSGQESSPAVTLDVDIVVPVFNEEIELAEHITRLAEYTRTHLPYRVRITIADNASTDDTLTIAQELANRIDGVRVVHLDLKGRGRALKTVWTDNEATVLAYMDLDLSTDLAALLPLIAPLLSGHSDLAIGSRLTTTSRVVRGPKREVLSRGYNLLLRTTLATRFSDAQCGFKAIRADRASILLPLIEDTGWFFDTELLVLAEKSGFRIHEVPVDWMDDSGSTVHIASTVMADLRGIVRLMKALSQGRIPLSSIREEILTTTPPSSLAGQLWRFCTVGAFSTLAYLVLYLILRPDIGAETANLVALLVTAVGNTAVNRRFTFGMSGRKDRWRHQLQGLVVFLMSWGLTSWALLVIDAHHRDPRPVFEITVLILANLVATALRFALLKSWVFRPGRPASAVPAGVPDAVV